MDNLADESVRRASLSQRDAPESSVYARHRRVDWSTLERKDFDQTMWAAKERPAASGAVRATLFRPR